VIARLTTAAATPDDYHFLKGAALNLGLTDFAALCQQGEHDARQLAPMPDLQVATCVCYGIARSALLDGVADRFGG
jgi:HPt (histidine-containing phosphotransfer) domain-containing protein